jgi:hypothetical protein
MPGEAGDVGVVVAVSRIRDEERLVWGQG